jgi:radical SAM superfamily enzyme YgiQ (UPF0313 family)
VEGVYVPDHPVKINLIRKMDDAWQPIYQVVAETDNPQLTPAFGNSFLLEVSRGCARGCRFCMAGCLYRPRRELSLGRLLETAELCRDATKMDKVALIGGAVCDHSHFVDLCLGLEDLGLQIALPSLRVESVQDDLLQILKSSGLKTITLAPESTWRLRKVVNKPITDDDVSNAVKLSFDNGLNVKLYYLVGLPTEEEGDLMDVISKIRGLYSLSPRPSSLRVSVNPFIPKPHTPFQWVEYDYKDVRRKLGYLQKKLGSKYFKTASARNGLIQYVLSMSGPDLGSLLEKSIHKKVSFNEWQKLKPIPAIGSLLPWKNIDVGLNDEILLDEYHKAMRGEITPWCETFGCYECGSCTRKVLKHADNI